MLQTIAQWVFKQSNPFISSLRSSISSAIRRVRLYTVGCLDIVTNFHKWVTGVGWIPAGLGVCIATAALVSFVWAVLSEDVTVFAPFIRQVNDP